MSMRAILCTIALSVALMPALAGCGARPAGHLLQATASASASPHRAPSFPVRAAQLVRGNTGWVLTAGALSMTSNGGQTWTAVTPPGVPAGAIMGVYFQNTKNGWVVSSSASNRAQLVISATTDGGSSWSTSPAGRPDPGFADTDSAHVDFVDKQHGWVVVTLPGSLSIGVLLHTTDGGRTWQQLPMPTGGPVEFISPNTGWLTSDGQPGTYASEKFYVTRDGGRTWRADTATPPAGFRRAQATYTLPAFTSPTGVLAGIFGGEGARAVLGFYQTNDGGASWALRATVPMGAPQGDVNGFPAVIGPATWIAVSMDTRQVVTVTGDGADEASVSPAGLPRGGLGGGSFTTTGSGWVVSDIDKCAGFKTDCTETIALFATTDEGAHWSLKLSSTTPG